MTTVAQVLNSKPDRSVFSIEPSASVLDAIRLMAEKNIGGLLVIDAGKIVGIITERDYARKLVLAGRSSKETQVRTVMTPSVICVGPEHTSDQCMGLMTENRIRHLPVLENGELIGLVSIGDLVKDIISEQQFIIEQLEHYIAGDLA